MATAAELRQALETYDVQTRTRKRTEIAGLAGAGALEGTGVALLCTTGNASGGYLMLTGMVLAGGSIGSLISRLTHRTDHTRRIETAEKNEKLDEILPALDLPYGFDDAVGQLKLAGRRATVDASKSVPGAQVRGSAINALVDKSLIWGEQGHRAVLAAMVLQTATIGTLTQSSNNARKYQMMITQLNTFFPIAEADENRAADAANSTFGWKNYLTELQDDQARVEDLRMAIGATEEDFPINSQPISAV